MVAVLESERASDARRERDSEERQLRRTLGVPDDARTVLVFGETSHWDPNWLFTSEEYYQRRIAKILDEVLVELEREPRRVFSIESMFFLQKYWERRPEQRGLVRALVEDGRLRFTGTGITTPDTLLPSTEAILRDYLHGQEWLRERGMTVEPRIAYLPDDFGHSPALPSILSALGFDRACVTRIDGMHFVGSDYRGPGSYPLPGSSADKLTHELSTQDFVWRAHDGSEVLCHWNAFTYFQGDMLAHIGVIRWMGITFGMPWRTGRHVAGRVKSLVKQLEPLSRTPYLFCPIGCDFNGPIPGLIDLLDRYNRTHYQDTGVWVVNAGMDDHLALVDSHRARLPVLELDPNPYWMGFYASRPDAKRRINRAARKLVLAEKLAFPTREHASELSRAWDLVVLSNHHDLVTGTSPDRVFREEQLPWLREAEDLADDVLARVAPADLAPRAPSTPPKWRSASGRLEVETPWYRLVLSEAEGGCIVSARVDDRELVSAPANDLIAYKDTGGLWRMGHEYRGGTFRELARASEGPAKITATETAGVLEVRIESELDRRSVERRLWLSADSPIVRMRVEGLPRRQRTITCRFPLASRASSLTMNVPGGVVERPMHKLFSPTFWPARSFAHLHDEAGFGLTAFLGGPACVALTKAGVMEWVALRHAPIELAFGFLPLPAHPAKGSEDDASILDYAVWLTTEGDFRQNFLPKHVRSSLRAALFEVGGEGEMGQHDLDGIANAKIQVDHDDVLVTALKPASRGDGVIARLRSYVEGGESTVVRLRSDVCTIRGALLCDARERDRAALSVTNGVVTVPIDRAITSVRLLV